jgi:hypothetical protein
MQEIAEFLNNYSSDFKLLLIRNQFGKSHYDASKNVVKSIKNSIKQDKIMAWVLKSPSVYVLYLSLFIGSLIVQVILGFTWLLPAPNG